MLTRLKRMFRVRPTVRGNDLTIYDQEGPWLDPESHFFRPLRRLAPARFQWLRQRIRIQGQSVLDVGCGGGYLSTLLARSGAEVTGIDLATHALMAARKRASREGVSVEYRQADAAHIPFADHCFDMVVCTDVLVHVPQPRKVIAEMVRVLRPGGAVYFSSISRTWWAHFVMVVLAERILRIVPRGTHDSRTFISPGRLQDWLAAEGMEVTECQGIGPVGWWRGPIFGSHPVRWVMYQGKAQCRRTVDGSSHAWR